nr:hypothetical protein [Rhizobium leguminosarum]
MILRFELASERRGLLVSDALVAAGHPTELSGHFIRDRYPERAELFVLFGFWNANPVEVEHHAMNENTGVNSISLRLVLSSIFSATWRILPMRAVNGNKISLQASVILAVLPSNRRVQYCIGSFRGRGLSAPAFPLKLGLQQAVGATAYWITAMPVFPVVNFFEARIQSCASARLKSPAVSNLSIEIGKECVIRLRRQNSVGNHVVWMCAIFRIFGNGAGPEQGFITSVLFKGFGRHF